jgi:hypothetical protein
MKVKRFIFLALMLLSTQMHALSTKGNQILDANGNPIAFKAFSWFGFNNGDTMVDGLWGNSTPLVFDFATVVYRQQLLGFNAVRLPFSFTNFTIVPQNFEQPCTLPTQSQIQASVTDPSVTVPAGLTIPAQVSPPTRIPGECDDYLPNDTTLNRFLWVINFFAKNGFYVLIDNHTEDPTVLQSATTWQQDWVSLYTAICQDPVSKKMVMLDLLNEPDGRGIVWEAQGSTPALTNLYLNAMDALYAVNNDVLFFIEGAGQGGIGCNWGDGFCTNETLIKQFGLSDPNPFFQALMAKPYLNQVVISPHVYPPSVTGQTTDYAGPSLWNRLSESFGYLTDTGYCFNGPCKIFPVALGEFGSMFATAIDIESMDDIALYLNNSGVAADGLHTAISSWFYWDWNANSGDTGGLVDNSWLNILWNKVEYLQTLGLKPWYTSTTPVQFGKLCITVAPTTGLTAAELLPIVAGSVSFPVTAFNTPVCESVAVGGYTITPPPITTSTMVFTAPAQNVGVTKGGTTDATITYTGKAVPVTGNFTVGVQLGTPWQNTPGSSIYFNVINLYIANTAAQAVNVPWTLAITNSAYQTVSSSWNLTVDTVANGTITSAVSQSWEALEPNKGNLINVGMIVTSTSTNFMPTTVTINGIPCAITISP